MKPLALSVGDPAGVGPIVAIEAIARRRRECFRVFGDAQWLAGQLRARGLPLAPRAQAPGDVEVVHVASWSSAVIDARAPTAEGGRAQLAALDAAIDDVLAGRSAALVTGPTSKEAVVRGGAEFVGQTERLATRSGLGAADVTMLFLGPRLRVGLVTTHLAVRDAAEAIDPPKVRRTVRHLVEALAHLGVARPRVAVMGLNPHAGEGGLFGREEVEVIAPALGGLGDIHAAIRGPVPAEAAFRAAADGQVDGVVAMIHDQATIASKLLDWGAAVNVTWGLPFLRTSVDHGVAYDAAARGEVSSAGMVAAVDLAARVTRRAAAPRRA